ncbi:MAG TPA: hypothetical protein VHE54_09545 [Puia sp.]|nr:hypothetical protein [Puia sp.]
MTRYPEEVVGVLAGILIGSAQVIYLINTVHRKITPSVLSWLGWAFLMGTSLVSQVMTRGWQWSMTSILCSTFGCLAIAAVAFSSGNFSLLRKDWSFLLMGCLCLCIYLLSNNPWATTMFAIGADGLLGVPTVAKAWREPASERSPAWALGMISSVLALAICVGHDLIYALFPAYLLLFNGTMAWLTQLRARKAQG